MVTRALRNPPLADMIYAILRDQLVDGTRSAGEQLNIAILCRELDVSQTPIREALARLEATGLVERVALKGYRVAPMFNNQDLLALKEARMVLEPALTRAAALRTTPDFLAIMRDSIDELHRASPSEEDMQTLPRYWSADERFHHAIARQSGNPFLAAAYEALGAQVQRFRTFTKHRSSDPAHAEREHRKIYEALARGDADGAASAMLEHVTNSSDRALHARRPPAGGLDVG